MRIVSAIVFVALVASSAWGQTAGDYRAAGTGGNWSSASIWETYKGSSWVAASQAPSSSNNVLLDTHVNGATGPGPTVTIDADASCANLTMVGVSLGAANSGPVLQFASSGSITLTVNGTFSLTGGSGSATNNRAGRPQLASNGNSSATLVFNGSYVTTTSSNTASNGNAGLNMNEGDVIFGGTSAATLSSGAGFRLGNLQIGDGTNLKTLLWTQTISGTMAVQSLRVRQNCTFNFGGSTQSPNIGSVTSGVVPLTGGITVETGATLAVQSSTSPNTTTITIVDGNLVNNGTMTLASANRIATVTMGSGSSVSIQTISGSGSFLFPGLKINNSNGVALGTDITVTDTLTLTAGKISTGVNTLTVISGFSGYGSGKFVEGNLAVPVGSTGAYIFPLGQGSDYLPVSLNFTSVTGSDDVTISAVDKSSTPPGGPLGSNQVLNRYFTVTKGSGITAFSADVTLSYSDADVATAGATESSLKVFQWDGAQWHPLATAINTSTNTADVSGITSFSDFVLSGTSDTPLPVTMKSLSATIDGGKVRLVFATATEIGVVGFTISRATAKAGPFQAVSSYSSNAALKAVGSTTTGGSYEFVDTKVSAGQTYYYMIEAVGKSGMSAQVGNVMEVQVVAPKGFAVYQNYPNPFNPRTTIRYDLEEQSSVRLEVYNVLGMKVRSESFEKSAGTFETPLDFSNMPSGIYYYRVMISGRSGSSFVFTKKMLLVK